MMMKLLVVFLGGGLGAVARYGAGLAAGRWCGTGLAGTLAVNVLGCLALGALYGALQGRAEAWPEEARLCVAVGFLGALTTFSTLNWEAFSLLREGRPACAAGYVGLSLALGLLATGVGYWWAK